MMNFFVSISFLAVIRLAFANALLGGATDDSDLSFGSYGDLNSASLFEESGDIESNSLLFGSSDLALLPPDDGTSYAPSSVFENSDTGLTTLDDENHSDYPIDLAGVDDSCSAKGDFQLLGKIRARDSTVCIPKPPAAAPLPLLELPTVDSFLDWFKKKPKPDPKLEPEVFPPLPALGSAIDAPKCLHPSFSERLCCAGPTEEVMESPRPVPIYQYIHGCEKSKLPPFFDRQTCFAVE
jgi:hypothetical protein